jgi:peroxiredoxin Q/BCP
MIQIGSQAPDFTSTDQHGKPFQLSSYKGKKNLVVFFYPKNFTPGCTAEACSFRDHYEAFMGADTEVVGISSDSGKSHEEFGLRYKLPYPLISDENKALRKLFQVPNTLFILPGRVTFIIDKEGIVRKVINEMINTEKHIQDALKELNSTVNH